MMDRAASTLPPDIGLEGPELSGDFDVADGSLGLGALFADFVHGVEVGL